MKNTMMVVALAATVSLSACYMGPRDHARSDRGYYPHAISYEVNSKGLSRADVRKVQKSLKKDGFYNGTIDGIWGPQTSRAILDYQNAHQQPQTGTLTVETLQQFGVRMHQQQ